MLNYLKNQYGIECNSFSPLGGGVGGDTFLVQSPTNKYIFKIIDANEMNRPEQEEALCRRLSEDGIPASVFLPGREGRAVSEYTDGRLCHLQEFIEGECFGQNKAPRWFMEESAAMLAKIHRSLSKLPPLAEGIGEGFFRFATLERARRSYEAALARAYGEGDEVAATDLEYRIELTKTLKQPAFDLSRLTVSNTHGDYTVKQVLCSGGKISGVIDWTCACRHPVVWEIARSFFNASPTAAEGRFDKGAFDDYVSAYCGLCALGEYDRENLLNLYYYQLAVSNYYGQYQASEGARREEFLAQAVFATKLLRGLRDLYDMR